MKASAKYWRIAILVTLMMALEGCYRVVHPHHFGHAYGHDYRHHYHGDDGYHKGKHGHGHHHHHHD